jgi:hydrogenase-4 component E
MEDLLTILFTGTAVYMATATRAATMVRLLVVQGLLLSGLGLIELTRATAAQHSTPVVHSSTLSLALIMVETLVFKAILAPWVLARLSKKIVVCASAGFLNIAAIVAIIVVGFAVAHSLDDSKIQTAYFAAAISAVFVGFYLMVSRKSLLVHLGAYLLMENAVFLLALALGSEMPMVVHTAILADVLTAFLLMGMLLRRIDEQLHATESEPLSLLKD